MAIPKVLQLLQTLSPKDRQLWLRSVEHERLATRPDIVCLAKRLVEIADGKRTLDREDLFHSVYPGETYHDLRLRHGMSELFHSAEKYILNTEIHQQPIIQDIYLLRAYRRKGLDNLFENVRRRIEDNLKEYPFRNIDYLYYKYLYEQECTRSLEAKKIRTVEPNLQHTTDALDTFYLAAKMQFGCSQLNHAKVVNAQYRYDLMDEAVQFVRSQEREQIPAIAAYYHIWCLLKGDDAEYHFECLREQLNTESGSFPADEARQLYIHAINYGIKQLGTDARYLRIVINLYRELLDRELFFEDGYMSPWMYKNVTVVALRLGELDWVEGFVNKYKVYINQKFQNTAYCYNLAKVSFARANYHKVLDLLQQVEYIDIFYALDSKSMLLKTYYELHEYEALDSLAASFRVFLTRRREVSESHRVSYLNLIRFVKAAVRVRLQRDLPLLKRLQQEIDSGLSILDRGWLRDKVAELESELTRKRVKS